MMSLQEEMTAALVENKGYFDRNNGWFRWSVIQHYLSLIQIQP